LLSSAFLTLHISRIARAEALCSGIEGFVYAALLLVEILARSTRLVRLERAHAESGLHCLCGVLQVIDCLVKFLDD